MKHLYFKCLLIGILSLGGIKAVANRIVYDCEVDGIYYVLDKTTKTASVTYKEYRDITGYTHYVSDYAGYITIPSTFTYDGTEYRVKSIREHAFEYCNNLISVNIPNSVTSIETEAFYGCI